MQMRLTYAASESCYALRSALRRNKGQEDVHQAVVIADMKRRSPTSAELPPDVNAFDDPAAWASQVTRTGPAVILMMIVPALSGDAHQVFAWPFLFPQKTATTKTSLITVWCGLDRHAAWLSNSFPHVDAC